jgi:hypothetical protein
MARRIHRQLHLSIDDLEQRYRRAKEPDERTWCHILWLLAQGCTATELSRVIGYRAHCIGQIAKRNNAERPAGMHNRRHTTSFRPPPALAPDLQEEPRATLASESSAWRHLSTVRGDGFNAYELAIATASRALNPDLKS